MFDQTLPPQVTTIQVSVDGSSIYIPHTAEMEHIFLLK